MKPLCVLVLLIFFSRSAHAQNERGTPLRTVPSVDLARYAGLWYEIARLPNRFQSDCTGNVTATYAIQEDGSIKVINRCLKIDGDTTSAEGVARRNDDDTSNAKLKVRFAPAILSFLPFVWGDYWVIGLAPDYSYAVIGEPTREYLWVLSRSPEMPEDLLNAVLERVKEQGYDLSSLVRTKQTFSR